jgi:N4-gp56 family major capsid protein
MAITQYGDISPRTAAYAYTEMLKHVEPVLVLSRFGQLKPLPKNKSQTIKFRRAVPYAPVTAPLQEGVTPSVSGTSFEDVSVTVQQWGDVHGLTDVVEDTHEDPVLKVMMQLTGEQAAATTEQVVYNVVKGGTSVYYANGASRSAVNTAISLNKQRAVVRALQRAKAKQITSVLGPSPNIGTSAVEAAYVAIGHTDIGPDVRNMTGFVPVAKYGSMKPICPEEVGAVENVRYILTPDLEPWANAGGAYGGTVLSTGGVSADVYPVLFFGQDAFGLTPLKNQKTKEGNNLAVMPIVINPNQPSASDPLGQRGFVGWKAWFAAVRLNETWMARLEVAASAL